MVARTPLAVGALGFVRRRGLHVRSERGRHALLGAGRLREPREELRGDGGVG